MYIEVYSFYSISYPFQLLWLIFSIVIVFKGSAVLFAAVEKKFPHLWDNKGKLILILIPRWAFKIHKTYNSATNMYKKIQTQQNKTPQNQSAN